MRPTMRRLAAVLIALASSACREAETLPPPRELVVVVAPVERRDLAETIQKSGQIIARNRARIAAEVAATVTEQPIEEGKEVPAGTVVVVLDSFRSRLEVDAARARAAEAQATLREHERGVVRVAELQRQNVASPLRLEEARTRLAVAKARLDEAKANLAVSERSLRDTSVTAPFRGVVARRLVSLGEFVSPGTVLFELIGIDPVEVEVHLPEADTGRVAVGKRVEVVVAPYPEERFKGAITFVSPTIDERTRTVRVKARIANPESRLRPGLFAHVEIAVRKRREVVLVPEEAILQSARGALVFRLTDGRRVREIPVALGVFINGFVEVTGTPLESGDLVVVRGQRRLFDGARVSVRTLDGEPATLSEAGAGAS